MSQSKKILLEYELPAQLEEIEKLALAVEESLVDYQECVFPVNLCTDELITNTINHGFKGSSETRISIQISATDDWLEIRIKDDAPQYDPFTLAPEPDLTSSLEDRKIGGLGVYLTKKLMTEYHSHYDGEHNVTVLRKSLKT